jgi:hypothetical protein
VSRPAGAGGNTEYVLDERLIRRYGSTYNLDSKKLSDTLTRFGPLPRSAQERLIRCLILADGRFRLRQGERITLSRQRGDLNAVTKTAATLLRLLGIDVKRIAPRTCDGRMISFWLSQAGITTANQESDAVNIQLIKAHEDVANSINGLLKLYDRARLATHEASERMTPRRGGARHQPAAKGQLIRDAIAIYSDMRRRFPNSGNKPGLGEPMRKFVRSVTALFGLQVTDDAINEAWRRRESKSK